MNEPPAGEQDLVAEVLAELEAMESELGKSAREERAAWNAATRRAVAGGVGGVGKGWRAD